MALSIWSAILSLILVCSFSRSDIPVEFRAHRFEARVGDHRSLPNGMSYRFDSRGGFSVLNSVGQILWQTGSQRLCREYRCRILFQNDGNLVAYEGVSPYWASDTAVSEIPYQARSLVFSPQEPYLRIYDSPGNLLWVSTPRFEDLVLRRQRIARVVVAGRTLYLGITKEGRIGLHRQDRTTDEPERLWISSPAVACAQDCSLGFRDGVLTLWEGEKRRWSTVAVKGGKYLGVLPESPFLTILDSQGRVIWHP